MLRSTSIVVAALVALTTALPLNNTSPSPSPLIPHKRTADIAYVGRAIDAVNQMQTWYDTNTGLYQGAWWNSANAITTLADFQAAKPGSVDAITSVVFPTSFAQAPKNPGYANFLDNYYDDELWWALAWIEVYDVTNDDKYLTTAAEIFEDAKHAWGTTPCGGGLWWSKDRTYVNAIANELYITAAAKLANRRPSTPRPGFYWDEAVKAHDWFVKSGMINSDNLVNDGLNFVQSGGETACVNNGIVAFTYNQGAILSGLTEMAWASNDNSYNDLANTLALAGIEHFTDSKGILHEPCEPNACDADEEQFKGVFARNLQFMVSRANSMPEANRVKYIQFLQTNADAIWADSQDGRAGLDWSKPVQDQKAATVQTQSSALDMLVAAAAVTA
jgi:predicted alpha-1,6-mannanase (GH76 family)